MSVSILNKLQDVTIEDREFTDKDTGEIIEYKEVLLHIAFDGEVETVGARIAKSEGKAAYRLIRLADEV